MTVPGNAVVVLVLVALFLAGIGYAAGRLHQWHRRRHDRDAAYRAGYETATRKTFSLAARIVGPRRERSAVRGSVPVLPVPPSPAPPPAAMTPEPPPAPESVARPISRRAAARSRRFHSIFPKPSITPAAASEHAPSEDPSAEPAPAAASDEVSRPGRHLVPDELVRAATYRLTPDRVARAKVPGAQPAPGAEDGDRNKPTALPKPRRRSADDRGGSASS